MKLKPSIRLQVNDLTNASNDINTGTNGILIGGAVLAGVNTDEDLIGKRVHQTLIMQGEPEDITGILLDMVMYMEHEHPGFIPKFMRMVKDADRIWKGGVAVG
jgi:hypothetical protein